MNEVVLKGMCRILWQEEIIGHIERKTTGKGIPKIIYLSRKKWKHTRNWFQTWLAADDLSLCAWDDKSWLRASTCLYSRCFTDADICLKFCLLKDMTITSRHGSRSNSISDVWFSHPPGLHRQTHLLCFSTRRYTHVSHNNFQAFQLSDMWIRIIHTTEALWVRIQEEGSNESYSVCF